MISAFADAETEAEARRLGAEDLLRKPFRRQELIDHTLRHIHPLSVGAITENAVGYKK
jgi:FixJ family two-component response regulator